MSLVEKWNEHIVQGNRLSRELEDFEGIMHVADMTDSKIALSGPSGSGTTFVDLVLSSEKMEEIKRIVVMSLNEARMTKEIELEKLMGVRKPATVNPVFEAAVKEMEAQPKPSTGRKKIELDIEQVKDLYINKRLSFRKVAEQCGCAENTIRNFAIKHGVTREAAQEDKPTYPNMTVEAVRKVYTQGEMNLADTAKYFGKTKDELHNFVKKNKLERVVVKSNDPFLDSNKMGKEEFKRQMLAGKK